MDLNLNSKSELRASLRGRLEALSPEDRAAKSLAIVEKTRHLVHDVVPTQTPICAAFLGLSTEPDLRTLVSSPVDEAAAVEWVYPRLAGTAAEPSLEFARRGTSFRTNQFKIDEPTGEVVPLEKVSAVLIPGLGFDKNMNRIGRGKGYYDRTLAQYQGVKIGICFSEQVLSDLPLTQDHDVRMDWIVTDRSILKAIEKRKQ